MYKNVLPKIILSLFFVSLITISCSSDDDPNPPSITLSQTSIDVKAEESNSVTVSYSTDVLAGSTITTTKLLDGVPSGTPEITPISSSSGSFVHQFTVTVEDSDSGIVKFNFTITDGDGINSQTELVVNIELTKRQLLLKYDWLLTDEIRVATGLSDINPVYTDDVYRFHEDGTYQKSIGAMADDFSDIWYKHCEWNFDEDTGVLKMHRTGAFGGDVYDVMTITMIDGNGFDADITYEGLDVFDPSYDPIEEYIKKMSAQARGNSFDPYMPGSDDDVEGPSATPCNTSDFVTN